MAFSTKELRTMTRLPGFKFHTDPTNMDPIKNILPGNGYVVLGIVNKKTLSKHRSTSTAKEIS